MTISVYLTNGAGSLRYLVFEMGSPDVLRVKSEQTCGFLHTVSRCIWMHEPLMGIRYALIEMAGKRIFYLMLKWYG